MVHGWIDLHDRRRLHARSLRRVGPFAGTSAALLLRLHRSIDYLFNGRPDLPRTGRHDAAGDSQIVAVELGSSATIP